LNRLLAVDLDELVTQRPADTGSAGQPLLTLDTIGNVDREVVLEITIDLAGEPAFRGPEGTTAGGVLPFLRS
jgi:hypothetical protein